MQPHEVRLTLAAAAWRTIAHEIAATDDGLETGGILLGHDNNGKVRITVAGAPGPSAVREPMRFLRDLDFSQRLADRAWRTDQSQWLGEWHSHPTSVPVPSSVDLGSYAKHLSDAELSFGRFISIIVGVVAQRSAVAAWVVTPDAALLVPFDIEEDHD